MRVTNANIGTPETTASRSPVFTGWPTLTPIAVTTRGFPAGSWGGIPRVTWERARHGACSSSLRTGFTSRVVGSGRSGAFRFALASPGEVPKSLADHSRTAQPTARATVATWKRPAPRSVAPRRPNGLGDIPQRRELGGESLEELPITLDEPSLHRPQLRCQRREVAACAACVYQRELALVLS